MSSSPYISSTIGEWLKNELLEVSGVISTHLESGNTEVNEICNQLATYRGKMLRPSILLLSFRAVSPDGVVPQGVRVAAGVVELIHLATLVHDDVLDEADLRRGKKTINFLKGNEAAVMLGDYLLSSAFLLCSSLKKTELNILLGEVTNTLCCGEIVQLTNRNNTSLDIEKYYQIIQNKTASLVAASCEMGAILGGGTNKEVGLLRFFGEVLGLAFQIKDDLLDLLQKKEVVGKPTGRDLEKGKLTLPIILLLKKDPSLKDSVVAAIRSGEGHLVTEMLKDRGCIDEASLEINRLVDSGVRPLKEAFKCPFSEQLCLLAEQLRLIV